VKLRRSIMQHVASFSLIASFGQKQTLLPFLDQVLGRFLKA